MLTTTIKGLRAHKLRLGMTTLAVLLGVAFMAGTLVLTDTLGERFDEMVVDVSAGTDVHVRSASAVTATSGTVRDRVPADLVEVVASVDGVAAVAGRTTGWVQLAGADGDPLGGGFELAPPRGENWVPIADLNPYTLVDGRAPVADHEVVIDRQSARDGGLAVGDPATVVTPSGPIATTVVGIVTVGDADSVLGATTVLFTDAAAQALIGEPDRYDAITVRADAGADVDALAASVDAQLPAGVEALTGAALVAEDQAATAESLAFLNVFFLTFAVVALGVGSFIIVNTFSITVAQRTRELAMLRAIGATRRQVMGSVLVEAVVVGAIASTLGLVAGLGVATGLIALLEAFGVTVPPGSVVVRSQSMALAVVVGMVITVAAAVLPARRAARIAPVAAMRDVAVDTSAGSRTRIAAGTAVTLVGATLLGAGLAGTSTEPVALVGLGAALVFVGVAALGPVLARPASWALGAPFRRFRGVTGAIATENAARSPKRTAATASALMIGVGLIGFITIVVASVKDTVAIAVTDGVAADLVVNSDSFGAGGFDPGLAAGLVGLPEIGAVSGVRMTPALVEGEGDMVIGIDTTHAGSLFPSAMVAGSLADLGADGVAVSRRVAADLDVAIGSTVSLTFADGTPRDLVLRGITEHPDLGDVLVDVEVLDRQGIAVDVQVFAALADGVDLETGRNAVERAVAGYPNASVQDLGEYIGWQTAMLDQLLGLIYALLGLAVVIAVLGIVNTLALSILERTRELGLLRALGMSRGQVRGAVRAEAVIIALLGTATGLVVGAGFGWAVVSALADEGLRGVVVPTTDLAVIALLAATAGVLAAVVPARRAARIDVLRALQTT